MTDSDTPTPFTPGLRNLITDVPGITVGQAQDDAARTGVTVIVPTPRAVGAVDVRGGGPGTRETDLLSAECLVEEVDAVVLSGGSAYGLEASSGVAAWLGARGRGFTFGSTDLVAPIVPSAILFDLTNGGDKDWGEMPPYRQLGIDAVAAAGECFALGTVGAGVGARAGALKGGIGSASIIAPGGFTIGAIAASNPFGSTVMPGSSRFWAAPFEQAGELGDQSRHRAPDQLHPDPYTDSKVNGSPGTNTTIGVVATDAALTVAEARRLAIMAQDGYARAIRPIHTPFDGDVVFSLATGARPLPEDQPRSAAIATLGALAADTLARAVARGVYEAESLGNAVSYRERFAS
jgi:L-aminopeptidase/D-esterase-like protein